jgi:hypothetical protein
MFKHEGFQVGQTIKAFDFPPLPDRGDCFVEAKIIQVHADDNGTPTTRFAHYVVQVTRDVFEGIDQQDEHTRIGRTYAIPMQMEFMEFDGRITEVK